jgi:7-cyano-7-deazaguanine synthase in queuosine biosynthesis
MVDDVIVVGLEVGPWTLTFPYRYQQWAGQVRVTYPMPIDLIGPAAAGIGLGVATYLGQLCLAPRIRLTFPVTEAMAEAMTPIAEMLYDIRCWKDRRPVVGTPRYEWAAGDVSGPVEVELSPRRSALLWSGGKDSTLSAILLQANGYQVEAVHITANQSVEQLEQDAVTALARDLNLRPALVRYEHPEFVAFSTAYAARGEWNDFPRSNLVPFGRDLLTALLCVPVAAALGAGRISLGHDHECRNSYLEYGGRSVPRNDIESTRGALALEAYIRRFVLAGVSFLPPVSGLTELRILHEMLVRHPDLMARAAFCFWGRNCGRCAKCLRYYLAQRLFGVEVLRFATNPLADGACPELDDILAADADIVLFQHQVLFCLGSLAERNDIRPPETRLAQFQRTRLDQIRSRLPEWAEELFAVGHDPQLPEDFVYDLAPVTYGDLIRPARGQG